MTTITIPKELRQEDDLVILPRREYEVLVGLKKFKEFTPTKAQKAALARARRNLKYRRTSTTYRCR